MLESITREQRDFMARINQQINKGRKLRLYSLPINPDESRPAKYKCEDRPDWNIELITEAEKWSDYTTEFVELFKPFYRAIDWRQRRSMEYAMPDQGWQYYKDLLHSSVKSLEDLRDRLIALFQ